MKMTPDMKTTPKNEYAPENNDYLKNEDDPKDKWKKMISNKAKEKNWKVR